MLDKRTQHDSTHLGSLRACLFLCVYPCPTSSQVSLVVRGVSVVLPKHSQSLQSVRLDLSSLVVNNCAPDASRVQLQLTDLHITAQHVPYSRRPMLQVHSVSVVVHVQETLELKATVAPIALELNTAQYVRVCWLVRVSGMGRMFAVEMGLWSGGVVRISQSFPPLVASSRVSAFFQLTRPTSAC